VALLHGPPGTGKTSLIFALLSELKFDNIYVLSFSATMKDSNFIGLVHGMKPNSALIMEDADTLVVNRKDKQGINFSSILNVLDGMLRPHGMVCFMTTNHIEAFDPAMLRAGRMDSVIHVPAMERATMELMATRLVADLHPALPQGCGKSVAALTANPAAVSSFLFERRGAFKSCPALLKELAAFIAARKTRETASQRRVPFRGRFF
jgi:chaperone BCS1